MEVEGYPNYMIYKDGRVWSNYGKGKFLKQSTNPRGYFLVGLWKDGKRKTVTVHRLLCNAYIDNPENKPEIDHIDNNKQNNNISNLRWVTSSENQRNKPAYGAVPFKGVSKTINGKKFQTRIRIDRNLKHLGTYETVEEASEAYIQYCRENNINIY